MSLDSARPARTLLRLAVGIALPLSSAVAIPAAQAAAAVRAGAAVCSVAHIYDVQAQDNRNTSQVGVSAGINSQSPSIYPGRTVPGPRRSVGILNSATGGYVLFGFVRDSVSSGKAQTYMEFRTASGGVGSTLGNLLGNKTLANNTWHNFKLLYNGGGVWSAHLDGAATALYKTPNLGFGAGHPFLRVLRTNCDGGGTANLRSLRHFPTRSTSGLWGANTCRGDTDPGKHLRIVSVSHVEVPNGQSAGGCAGSTHG